MCYEGCIANASRAQEEMRRGNVAEKGVYLSKAVAIVTELLNTLDTERGGEIAERLELLYRYVLHTFTQANLKRNPELMEGAIPSLARVEGWLDRTCRKRGQRLNRPTPFESAGERLAGILEIAREQRELLARGDLDAVQKLQERRQQLMEGIQSLDKRDEDAHDTLSKVLHLDRQIGCLLSLEVHDIKEKMKTIGSLRKLLQSRSPTGRRPPRQLSRHA